MIAIRNILVPTDFSEPSTAALRYAVALAEAFESTLHVLHVIENPYMAMGPAELYVAPPVNFIGELEKEAERRLAEAVTPDERARFHVREMTRHGRPHEEIDGYAKENAIDLIVMGTHGRTALAHLLIGSVAEKVVRTAPCPVLTVRS
jgi:nucleotide-binding universal stress UspA family protein